VGHVDRPWLPGFARQLPDASNDSRAAAAAQVFAGETPFGWPTAGATAAFAFDRGVFFASSRRNANNARSAAALPTSRRAAFGSSGAGGTGSVAPPSR
jgi:hypothetical protein